MGLGSCDMIDTEVKEIEMICHGWVWRAFNQVFVLPTDTFWEKKFESEMKSINLLIQWGRINCDWFTVYK